MSRRELRLRLVRSGLEIIDPDRSMLPLLQAISPGFTIRTAPLPGFRCPQILACRRTETGLAREDLERMSDADLRERHNLLMGGASEEIPADQSPPVSLLDLKIELSRRLLRHCTLCARVCRVNRLAAERGVCGLTEQAYVAEDFLHVCEEPPINPAYVLNLQGCGLRCRYCQQYKLLPIRPDRGTPLAPEFWKAIDLSEARSLEFCGGNPDESAYAILTFLRAAPEDLAIPIVWNNHGYSTPELLSLLDRLVDVYVLDCKYGNDTCGQAWSGVPEYFSTLRSNMAILAAQPAVLIVRLLVLPGHVKCCHQPALEWLSGFRDRILLKILSQYAPDYTIRESDGAMARRPTGKEVDTVRTVATRLRFALIE